MKYVYLSIAGMLCFTVPSCKKNNFEHIYTGDAYIYKYQRIPFSRDYTEEWDTVPVRIVVKFLSGNVYFESDHPDVLAVLAGGFLISDSSKTYGYYYVTPFTRSGGETCYKLKNDTITYWHIRADPMNGSFRHTVTLAAHKK